MAEQLPAPFKLTWEDKFEKARTYKDEGNKRFKAKEHKSAIGKYHRALLYLKGIDASKQRSLMPSIFGDREEETKMPQSVQKEFVQLKANCYNNLAACILQTESPSYEKVLQYCDEVLQLSPNNVKAMYRKGVAFYNLSRLDDALEELLKARNEPDGMKDANIKRYISLCQQRAELQNKTLRKKYRAMFDRMTQSETSVVSDVSACGEKSQTSSEDVTAVDTPTSTVIEDVTTVNKTCSPVTKDTSVGDRLCSPDTDDVTIIEGQCTVVEEVNKLDTSVTNEEQGQVTEHVHSAQCAAEGVTQN